MKKGKNNFKKWKKALIGIAVSIGVILLAFIVFAIGLAIKHSNFSKDNDGGNINEITTNVYEQLLQDSIPGGADDAVEVDTTPIYINLSDEKLAQFEEYVSTIDVEYDYEEAYNIDAALEIYSNTVNSVSKHSQDIRLNGKFDANHFYEIVKANNKKFFEDEENQIVAGLYEEYSNKELKKICKQFCEALPAIAATDPTVDIDMVCCYLYDIKIIKKLGSLDFGGFDMENRFYLNYEYMKTASFAVDTDDIEQTTFYHEMMHAFQFACKDIKKPDEDRMGITHTYHELKVNPLSWYWLLEGSAEMNMSQYLNVRYSTYKSRITYIDSLNFVSNIYDGNSLRQMEKICFRKNLEEFFDLLDVSSQEDKKEIIKMMYSIDIIQQSKYDFYEWYEEKYNVDLSISNNGEETYLRLKLKEDALMTLTKLFYRNLARRVNSGDASLQDAYYLMRVFEADLDRHFSNNTVGYMEFFHNFYDTYVTLQNEFFKVIADENNMSVENIAEGFDDYSMNAVGKSPNCDLKFLNNYSRKYITFDFVNSFYMKGYPSIRNCQKQTQELDKKYPIDDMIVNKVLQ